ncbi:MAG TPA: DUF885 domain-containing protein [Sphingomicrobium sp.]
MNYKLSRREALAGLSAGAAAILAKAAPAFAAPATEAQAKALLDGFADHLIDFSPEGATSLGIDTGKRAQMRYHLSDRSEAGQKRFEAMIRSDLAAAEAVDTSALPFATRTSVEVVKSAYKTGIEGFAFPFGDVAVGGYRNTPYPVNPVGGAFVDVPQFLTTDHPIETAADADAYVSRLREYPGQIDGELARVHAGAAKGMIPPDFIVDRTIKQITIARDGAAKGGSMVETLEQKTKEKGLSGPWVEQVRKIVTGDVVAALDRQLAEFAAQRKVATSAAGISSRPQGPEYYRWALKASTTTNLSPDEVHQIGLQQLKELHGRMDPILKSLGYSKGSVGERMQALAKDPRYQFSEGDKGRAEILAYIQERLAKIRAVLPRAFNTMVPGHLEVRRMSPEQEPGAPAAYGGAGSIDGKIPGKFWINLRDTHLHSKYSLPDLASHESIPGHVWQGEYANKLPLIRTLLAFNAYSEGWALYAEQLVDELGVYDDFPAGRLGYLQSIAFRCCRLVVDTGLHVKNWSRQQAVDYFVNVNGSNPLEVSNEVDRYCVWPGQACGYKVGQNEILRLREKAKRELGAKYDLKAFDDAVVMGGNVPMDVLAKNIDDYIARTKRA